MGVLDRAEGYTLWHEYETAFLTRDRDGTRWPAGSHYGDPTCGVIGPGGRWCVTGGEGVVLFDRARGTRSFFRHGDATAPATRAGEHGCPAGTCFVHALHLAGPTTVHVVLDPNATYAGTWVLEVVTAQVWQLPERAGGYPNDSPRDAYGAGGLAP